MRDEVGDLYLRVGEVGRRDREVLHDGQGEGRMLVYDLPKLLLVQNDEPGVVLVGYGCGSPEGRVDHGHLAEKLAGPYHGQRDLAAGLLRREPDPPGIDDVHLEVRRALFEDDIGFAVRPDFCRDLERGNRFKDHGTSGAGTFRGVLWSGPKDEPGGRRWGLPLTADALDGARGRSAGRGRHGICLTRCLPGSRVSCQALAGVATAPGWPRRGGFS